jgi:hypothetical protein
MNERELRLLRLRAVLDNLRALREEIQSIRENQQASNDARSTQPIQPFRVDITHPRQLDLARQEYYTPENRERNSFWRTVEPWLAWGGLLAVAALAVLTLLTLREIRKQTPKIIESADAAKSAAQVAAAALLASVEQFRTDERARIELEPFKAVLLTPASVGFPALFTYTIYPKNTGKTVAYGITVSGTREAPLSTLGLGDNPSYISRYQDRFLLGKLKNGPPETILFRRIPKALGPNVVSPVPFDMAGQAPTNGLYSFLIGRIDYADAFNIEHWVKFCFFISDPRGSIENCMYGNDEDRNPEVESTPKR